MPQEKNLAPIGIAETIDLIDFEINAVPAKIDTGADVSSIWASNIEETKTGLNFVLFDTPSPHYTGKVLHLPLQDYSLTHIASSFGHRELRYKIKLRILLKGRRIKATFTLSDRSQKTYPILLGRRLLHGKFIVDVSTGDLLDKKKRKRTTAFDQDTPALKYPGQDCLKIGILSKGPGNNSTRRLRQEALNRGHTVRVINYSKCYVALENGSLVVRHNGESLHDIDVIVPRIAAKLTNYGAAIVRQFEMQNIATTTTSIALVRSRDKLRSTQLLAKAGVGIPRTVFARETADLDDVLDQVGGAPVIIKVARGTHGKGVVLAETKKAAKAVMQAFYVEGVSFIVQEFIKESAGTDIRVFVVNGQVVASMQRQSLSDDFRSNLHQGGSGIKIKLTAQERKTARLAAKAIGLPVCGVDMMRSNNGPLVLEVNSSPGLGIEQVTEINVASKIIDYIELAAKTGRRKDKVGA